MRQVTNELFTAEEKAALEDDLEQLFEDAEACVTVTYHSSGTLSTNNMTGAITESGGSDVSSVKALKVMPTESENEAYRYAENLEGYMIQASDLSGVTPKLADYIVLGTTKKYVHAFIYPAPFIHYKFLVGDKGKG